MEGRIPIGPFWQNSHQLWWWWGGRGGRGGGGWEKGYKMMECSHKKRADISPKNVWQGRLEGRGQSRATYPFTWQNRKSLLENQMVCTILFGKRQKIWAVICVNAIFLFLSGDWDILCSGLFSHLVKFVVLSLFPPRGLC